MTTDANRTTAALSPTAKQEAARLRIYSFSIYTIMAVIVSYIPLYFHDRGFSEQQIGILYSIGPALSIFANLIMGMASDKYRTIRRIMTLLLFGQLLMVALLFSAQEFFIVCLIMGGFYFFQTPLNPLNDSLILLSVKHTGRSYPSIRIFGSLGFAMAALFIGLFLGSSGSGTTMIVLMLAVSVSLALTFTLKDYQGSLRKMEFSGFFKLVRKPDVVTFFFLIMIISTAHRMNEGFLAIIMRQMGASESLIGIAWMASSISEIPILYLLGKYGHKFKELPLLAIAGLFYAVRFWFLSEMTSPGWAILIQAMHSITFGIFFSTALRYMTTLIPDEFRASGQALYAVVWMGFSGLLSGLLGGYVLEQIGQTTFFYVAMGLSLLASAGFMLKHLRSR
ncbi:MFS transporter [Paenibacillus abyssi]|uniref:Transporter YwbF n=1 Tax=Paenibacillus abyssi TaxID=1340531 RepID=A0A917LEI8_9BACL|nr:MFS transporter [Paenibacillus abyssi]GGG15538.1 putative transporter YwbF [Paenibacillus abyssi]